MGSFVSLGPSPNKNNGRIKIMCAMLYLQTEMRRKFYTMMLQKPLQYHLDGRHMSPTCILAVNKIYSTLSIHDNFPFERDGCIDSQLIMNQFLPKGRWDYPLQNSKGETGQKPNQYIKQREVDGVSCYVLLRTNPHEHTAMKLLALL